MCVRVCVLTCAGSWVWWQCSWAVRFSASSWRSWFLGEKNPPNLTAKESTSWSTGTRKQLRKIHLKKRSWRPDSRENWCFHQSSSTHSDIEGLHMLNGSNTPFPNILLPESQKTDWVAALWWEKRFQGGILQSAFNIKTWSEFAVTLWLNLWITSFLSFLGQVSCSTLVETDPRFRGSEITGESVEIRHQRWREDLASAGLSSQQCPHLYGIKPQKITDRNHMSRYHQQLNNRRYFFSVSITKRADATSYQWATHDCHSCSSSANYNVNSNFTSELSYILVILLYFLLFLNVETVLPVMVKQPGQKQVPLLDFTSLFHTHQLTHYFTFTLHAALVWIQLWKCCQI